MDAEESKSKLTQAVAELRKSQPESPLLEVERQCELHGFSIRWQESSGSDSCPTLGIGTPNGRDTVWRRVDSKKAYGLVGNGLIGPSLALGDYNALHFRDIGVIEAEFRDMRRLRNPPLPRGVPGLEYLDADNDVIEPPIEELRRTSLSTPRGVYWRLRLAGSAPGSVSVELGTASKKFAALDSRSYLDTESRGRVTTLRISGAAAETHDEALALLRKVSDAVFFDLDNCYGLTWQLERDELRAYRASWRRKSDNRPLDEEPRFPVNEYAPEPMSLYWYARSADRMPLLEYLAYYQVLEYFFSQYVHKATLEQLRQELRRPRFRVDSDTDLSKLVSIAMRPGPRMGNERDQLRATIAGITSEESLREYFSEIPERAEYFSGRQSIKDLPTIQPQDRKNDFCSQVTNRVYDLRCRIVHSKEDGGSPGTDLLLPYSREVDTIWPDVELLRFLAREALINGAREISL